MTKRKIYWKTLKKTALFVDAANIFYSQKTLGWRLDYEKFLNYFKSKTDIVYAGFYSAGIATNKKQQKFFQAVRGIGYSTEIRELKIIKDKRGKTIVHKGDFDVKIAIDLVLMAKKFDSVILASGDSDFAPALEYLKQQGKRIIVVSARGHISRELISLSSRYLPLENMKNKIKKEKIKKSPRQRRGKFVKLTIPKTR